MTICFAAIEAPWMPVVWTLMVLFGLLGVLAVISPRLFACLALRGGQWIDTDKLADKLNHRVNIDEYVLPHSRVLGGAVIAAVGLLALVLAR
jgi:hypothetical protein